MMGENVLRFILEEDEGRDENDVIETSPFGEMEVAYCYAVKEGVYTLSVNRQTVEVIKDLFRAKALVELSNDCTDESYKSLKTWKELDEILKEKTEE